MFIDLAEAFCFEKSYSTAISALFIFAFSITEHLKFINSVILRQDLHLIDCDGIQLCQAFWLRHTLIDKHRIQIFQVGQTDKLRHVGIVTDISLQIWMTISPLLRRHAKKRHILYIGFIGIHKRNLSCRKFRGNESFLYSIRMDAVIDFGKISLDIPTELFEFLGLESLKFLD